MALKVHHLRPAPGAHTDAKRVGRGEGGKGGKTAGRGTKGTGARKNVPENFEGGQMPLHMRLPKLRGFKNPFRVEYQVVNVAKLGELFPEGGEVGVDDLVAKGAVSIREHKQARAEEERARAEYAAAAASLEQARLNLEYTRVEAPISGRVRRALVTEGAFANQNEFTHLTTIEQIDPIYVRFSQPASQYSSLRRAVVSGLWKGVPLGEIKVRLLLSNPRFELPSGQRCAINFQL